MVTHPNIVTRHPDLRLLNDQRSKTAFQNVRHGLMHATSFGGSLVGKGGSRIVLDDPETIQQASSPVRRARTLEQFTQGLSTRADDKSRSGIVLVQQRLHANDLTAQCERYGFTRISLPALEPAPRTYVFPLTGRTVARSAGEPLWPARENLETLEAQRLVMGTSAFNAQYLQRPDDPSGSMFRAARWLFHDCLPAGSLEWFQSWDVSFKAGPKNDFVVGLVAVRLGAMVYIVDRFKMRADFPATKQAIIDMCRRYPETRTVLIEEAANGAAIAQDLAATIPGLIAIRPEGGKLARASVAQSTYVAGQVWLPNPYDAGGILRADRTWVPDFIETLKVFPNGPFDDDVDALSQLLVYLRQHPVIEPLGALFHPDPDSVRNIEAVLSSVARMRARQEARSLDWSYAAYVAREPEIDVDEADSTPVTAEKPVSHRRHAKDFFSKLRLE